MRRLAVALLLAAGPAGAGDLAVVTSQTAQAVSLVDLDSGAVRVTVYSLSKKPETTVERHRNGATGSGSPQA